MSMTRALAARVDWAARTTMRESAAAVSGVRMSVTLGRTMKSASVAMKAMTGRAVGFARSSRDRRGRGLGG